MNKEIITFGDIEIEKNKFHCSKHRINIINVDVDRIIISKKIPFCKNGFKCFIGYSHFIYLSLILTDSVF